MEISTIVPDEILCLPLPSILPNISYNSAQEMDFAREHFFLIYNIKIPPYMITTTTTATLTLRAIRIKTIRNGGKGGAHVYLKPSRRFMA